MTADEELKEIADEMDSLIRVYREKLNEKPRILNPLREALEAARTAYQDSKG